MLLAAAPLRRAGLNALLCGARNQGQNDSDTFSSLPRFAEDLNQAPPKDRGRGTRLHGADPAIRPGVTALSQGELGGAQVKASESSGLNGGVHRHWRPEPRATGKPASGLVALMAEGWSFRIRFLSEVADRGSPCEWPSNAGSGHASVPRREGQHHKERQFGLRQRSGATTPSFGDRTIRAASGTDSARNRHSNCHRSHPSVEFPAPAAVRSTKGSIRPHGHCWCRVRPPGLHFFDIGLRA